METNNSEWKYYTCELRSGGFSCVYSNRSSYSCTQMAFIYKTMCLKEHINKIFNKVREFKHEYGTCYSLNYVIAIIYEIKRVLQCVDEYSFIDMKKLEITVLELRDIVCNSCFKDGDEQTDRFVKSQLNSLYFSVKGRINQIWERFNGALEM
jgi:hypothetical protein